MKGQPIFTFNLTLYRLTAAAFCQHRQNTAVSIAYSFTFIYNKIYFLLDFITIFNFVFCEQGGGSQGLERHIFLYIMLYNFFFLVCCEMYLIPFQFM